MGEPVSSADLLARVDERTKSIQNGIQEIKSDFRSQNEALIKRVETTEKRINQRIAELEEHVEKEYVRKDRYSPVEKIIYGMVGLILLTVVAALIVGVINPKVPSQ